MLLVSVLHGERTKAHWGKSPLGQKPTGQYPTGQKPTAYILTVGVHLSSTPGISGPGSATDIPFMNQIRVPTSSGNHGSGIMENLENQ